MVYIVNHGLGDRLLVTSTDSGLSSAEATPTATDTAPVTSVWEECTEVEKRSGFRVRIQHNKVNINTLSFK